MQGVADTMRLGQSYKSIGFVKERATINRALADRGGWSPTYPYPNAEHLTVLRNKVKHEKVLTGKARRIIANELQYGLYSKAVDAPEPTAPAYMAPSVHPNDYSSVRNLPDSVPALLTMLPSVVLYLR